MTLGNSPYLCRAQFLHLELAADTCHRTVSGPTPYGALSVITVRHRAFSATPEANTKVGVSLFSEEEGGHF